MKKTIIIVVMIIFIGALVVFKMNSGSKKVLPATTNTSGQRTGIHPRSGSGIPKTIVSVYYVKPEPIEEKIVATGTIIANKEIELRNEAAGRIIGIYFEEGAQVKKGQLLLKLNDSDLQAQLSKTIASLNLAKEREKRQKSLFTKQAISQEDYETAQRDLASCEADVALIKAQIEKTNLTAPFDGIIGLTTLNEGGYINIATKVANLVSLTPLKIDFSVAEKFIGKITKNSTLNFFIEGSTTIYNAKVIALEPKIDESTRTFKVRAECLNPDARVIPGSFAKIDMIIRQNPSALLIPSESLIPDVEGYKIYVVQDSTIRARSVLTGFRDERNVEIIKGLNAGDAVVVSGILSVRPGMIVDIDSKKL